MTVIKIFFLALLLIIPASFAQQLKKDKSEYSGKEAFQILYSSVSVIPAEKDSCYNISYMYRIPYNRLVFLKTGEKYSAEYNLALEVFDSNNKFIVRNFSDRKITVETFEETDAGNFYSQGLINFEIGTGEYTIFPVLTDLNSSREIKLKPAIIRTENSIQNAILAPLIVNNTPINCEVSDSFILTNFEDNFPFAEEKYNLIIPVADTQTENIFVTIINEKDTIFNSSVAESFNSKIKFDKCRDDIVLSDGGSAIQTKNFIVRNFSNKLKTGNLLIFISKNNSDDKKKADRTIHTSVVWYNKPFSLFNPENAIRALKAIENESVIDKLLSVKKEDYENSLFNYWKKYDPTPESEFNQLMNEYYERVDYAMRNFSSIAGKNGIESDRGKIFVQFGKPNKIERSSNEYGKVVETWIYEKQQRKFVFVDIKGTGEFSLTKG